MHAGIPEIDVHEIRVAAEEDCGRTGKIFQPATFERADARLVDKFDIRKRITIGVFAKPGNDKRVGPAQRSDLPIDVEHLCLQEIGAETSDESAEVCGGHGGRIIYQQSHSPKNTLRAALNSSMPRASAATIGMMVLSENRVRRIARFSSAPGRSILLAAIIQGRRLSVGS